MEMLEKLERAAASLEGRVAMVRAGRLAELREALLRFREAEDLNGFQEFVLDKLYALEAPETPFEVRSILIAAVPRPMYANVEFTWAGAQHACKALMDADMGGMVEVLQKALAAEGYQLVPDWRVPLKRLAVQSGLAEYGRNNITYVPGLGSRLGYVAFFSDAPCEEDGWREMTTAAACEGCTVCQRSCPTGAIRADRFLLDTSRCLSFINEGDDADFPDWLPAGVHHTPYDCLLCQLPCPMNAGQCAPAPETVYFTEEETRYLLEGAPYEEVPEALAEKARPLDLFQWSGGLARNIRALVGA